MQLRQYLYPSILEEAEESFTGCSISQHRIPPCPVNEEEKSARQFVER